MFLPFVWKYFINLKGIANLITYLDLLLKILLFDLEINWKVQLFLKVQIEKWDVHHGFFQKKRIVLRYHLTNWQMLQQVGKKSKDILVESDNYLFSVSVLYVGLFMCIIMLGITFPCLKQSVKLVNLLLSYIPGYILENKGCIQFNCKGANIDSTVKLQVSRKSVTFFINPFSIQGKGGIHPPEQMFFVTSEPLKVLKWTLAQLVKFS